jgi:hypothetical protein
MPLPLICAARRVSEAPAGARVCVCARGNLDAPVGVEQQPRRFEIAVQDGRLAPVQIRHAWREAAAR